MKRKEQHDEPPLELRTSPHELALRRTARNPALAAKLKQMALPLKPFVQVDTGVVHPAFPGTLLAFWLLSDDQLESLASFYHQRTPHPLYCEYPRPVAWQSDVPLELKRKRLGRFIGLNGCESPAEWPTASFSSLAELVAMQDMSEEEIEYAARKAREQEDLDRIKRKMGWY